MGMSNERLTAGMVSFFAYRTNKAGRLESRAFHTGRNGSTSPVVAKAMERRGYAVLVRKSTWETYWQVTEAGAAAWAAYQAQQA
jgi:hypothetical protein